MPVLKSKLRDLVEGQFYLAYSKQSKMLSSNGTGGVIVQFLGLKEGRPEVKVWRPNGKTRNMTIARLDERKDAFMVALTADLFKEHKLKMGEQGVFAWPQYTGRMEKAHKDGVKLEFQSMLQPNDRYPAERIDGTMTFIVKTTHDDIVTYLNHFQLLFDEDMLAKVCSADELEARKLEEARLKVEKLKEGGVRLTVGKMKLGQKILPDLLTRRKEFIAGCHKNKRSCVSFAILFGDDLDNIKEYWDYDRAPCHAQLTKRGDGERQVILSSASKEEYNADATKAYKSGLVREWVDFLINRSIYADMFIDKDPDSVLKLGYVVNGNTPSNAVAAALTASRQVWEYPARVAAWKQLSKHIDENAAYFICMAANGTLNEDGTLRSLSWNNYNTGHTPINYPGLSNMGVMNLIYGNFTNANDNMNTYTGYAHPNRVHALHEDGATHKVEKNTLFPILKSMQVEQGKVDKSNPFDIPKSPADLAIEFAVTKFNHWLQDNGYD